MENLMNRISGLSARVLIIFVIVGLGLMVAAFQGAMGFGPMALVLGGGVAVSLTASFAKQDPEDDDNWTIGFTALVNFLIVFYVLTHPVELLSSDWGAWALAIAVLAGVALLYWAYPNWWVWPIAWLLGGPVCGISGAMLYWGLTAMQYMGSHEQGRLWEVLCFVVTGVATFVWIVGNLVLVELMGARGLGNLRATAMPGDGFGIHRKKSLWAVVANTDNVARTELTDEQLVELRRLQRAKNFDGIVEWAENQDIDLDPRWFLSPYLMVLPNVWVLPMFGKIAPWNAKFDLAHSGDTDGAGHGADGHGEADDTEVSPPWIHFTLRPIPDVDVEKCDVSTGQRSEPVTIVTGVDSMQLVDVWNFMKFGIDWRHHLDTLRDNLMAAIGAQCGSASIMIAGHSVFELLRPFQVQVGTAFGVGTAMFPGAPRLQEAIDAYGDGIDHLGLWSEPVMIKRVVPTGAVDSARSEMTRAAGAAEVARAVLNARLAAIEGLLTRLVPDEDRRGEIMAAILPAMILGDSGGIATALAQFGLAGNVAANVTGAARGNTGGGGGGGGRGGHNS